MKKLAVVKVPNRVTKDHISENIEPVFREKGNIRLATYFPSVNMKKDKTKTEIDSVACMAMYGTLELQPEIRGVVDSMVERLRTLSRKSDGRFVAVDLRIDVLEKKGCKDKAGSASKNCYDAGEIATFLRKIGFGKDTTIYLTQSRWDSSLDALKELFPKTYTKVTFCYSLIFVMSNCKVPHWPPVGTYIQPTLSPLVPYPTLYLGYLFRYELVTLSSDFRRGKF